MCPVGGRTRAAAAIEAPARPDSSFRWCRRKRPQTRYSTPAHAVPKLLPAFLSDRGVAGKNVRYLELPTASPAAALSKSPLV